MIRAGLPTTMACGGTERVTTAPAPTIAPTPISSPGRIVAFAPIEAPRRTSVRGYSSSQWRLRGKRSLVNVALGPMNTSSSTVTPLHSCTPDLTVTRSPTTTPFSTNTPSHRLQSSPTRAPSSTCANAHTFVPRPTSSLSHRPCGCTKTSGIDALPVGRRLRGDLLHVADDRARPTLDRLVRAPDVGADDPQAEAVHAGEEDDHEDRRRVAGHVDRSRQAQDRDEEGEERPDAHGEHADRPQDAHREIGEREHAVGQVAQLAVQRPAALALARAPVVRDGLAAVADPEQLGDQRRVDVLERA